MGTLLRTLVRGAAYSTLRRLGLAKTIAIGVVALVSLWVLTGDARAQPIITQATSTGSGLALTTTLTTVPGTALDFTLSEERYVTVEAHAPCTTCSNGAELYLTWGPDAGPLVNQQPGAPAETKYDRQASTTTTMQLEQRALMPAGTYRVRMRAARVGNAGPNIPNGFNTYTRVTIFDNPVTTLDWSAVTGKPSTFAPAEHGNEAHNPDFSTGGGSVAWADITGKPSTFPPSAHDSDHNVGFCNADGTEADADCGGTTDLSGYYTASEVDAIAHLASDTCGGPSLPPCEFEYASGGGSEEKINLLWWGIWAVVGLMLALMIAPLLLNLLNPTRGL